MSTAKTKEELVRLSWLTELRRQGDRQCRGVELTRSHRVCALMLLAEVAGKSRVYSYQEIGSWAGLDCDQTVDVIERNDGVGPYEHQTFAEIADVVAGWFPPTPG